MNYSLRIENLKRKLKEFACDALLVEDPTNLYYLTGQELSSGILLIQPNGALLLVDNRYFELCQKSAPCQTVLSDKTSLPDLLSAAEFTFIQTLGFDTETTSYKRFQDLQKSLEEVVKRRGSAPALRLLPLECPVKTLRMIKDEEELELLREAATLGSQGFDYVCSLLREGITEAAIAIELEIYWKRRGSKSLAFDPIIAFGPNSSMPHYRAGQARLKRGMPVLIDIGVNLQHYHSDMTRVVFFGEPDAKIRKIYAIVEKAQQMALALCRPGTPIGELDKAARGYIAAEGYGDYFGHGLGHGIGLEIHEAPAIRNKLPFKDMLLEPGMVITIEPGIYLPDIGGVRIEDSIVITPTGHDNLTQRSTKAMLYQDIK